MESSDSPPHSVDPCVSAEGSLGLRGERLSETSCVWTDIPQLSESWGPRATAEGRLRCGAETLRCGAETNRMRTEEELMEDYTGIYTTLSAIQVRDWNSVDS